MTLELVPIRSTMPENGDFAADPACADTLQMSVDYYKVIGFEPPWICYYAKADGKLVGSGAFKGKPVNGRVELAYGTFADERGKGIGTAICRKLVELARATDPAVTVTARTLPEPNHSTRILEKSGFRLLGTVQDPDDGDVWEWQYQ
jgi:[ribosomal protein S5]-alanine N-acetyltransferase